MKQRIEKNSSVILHVSFFSGFVDLMHVSLAKLLLRPLHVLPKSPTSFLQALEVPDQSLEHSWAENTVVILFFLLGFFSIFSLGLSQHLYQALVGLCRVSCVEYLRQRLMR